MGITFWLSANNEQIDAHMPWGSLVCVGTLVFSRMDIKRGEFCHFQMKLRKILGAVGKINLVLLHL